MRQKSKRQPRRDYNNKDWSGNIHRCESCVHSVDCKVLKQPCDNYGPALSSATDLQIKEEKE